MKYKILFVDIDDTLLDFQKSEEIAIRKLLSKYINNLTEDIVKDYKQINVNYWKMFERGEIEREALLIARFKDLFEKYNCFVEDYSKINEEYFSILSSVPIELDGAYEFLEKVFKDMKIYAITNGVKRVQTKRLSMVNITKFFEKIYISEEVGFQKPEQQYFDYVLKDLGYPNKNDIVILGDSLTSDIQGGINCGIDTIWFNPHKNKSTVKYTYSISEYNQFFDLVK